MFSNQPPRYRDRLRPLRWWWIGLAAVAVVGMGLGFGSWLWWEAGALAEPELSKARMEAIRTGLTAAGGTGAAFALLLAVRRQRSTEADLVLKAETVDDTRHDASEKRINELQLKAADQLGSPEAPVRLNGLHALARLAESNPDHRQMIVDVLCAYLRMPYDPATGKPEERQVRLTAQRILAQHLHRASSEPWDDIDLNLDEATLLGFDLLDCAVRTASFTGARFVGETQLGGLSCWRGNFDGAHFEGAVSFYKARIRDRATFQRTTFAAWAEFGQAVFAGDTSFHRAHVSNGWFRETRFQAAAGFGEATFGEVRFTSAHFRGATWFTGARFTGGAWFTEAEFAHGASFDRSEFGGEAQFWGSRFGREAGFRAVRFRGRARFGDTTFYGPAVFGEASFDGRAWFAFSAMHGPALFTNARFTGDAWFNNARCHDERTCFDNTWFGGMALFREVDMNGASFSGTVFTGFASFSEGDFAGDTSFLAVSFGADADLRRTTFRGALDVRDCRFTGNAGFDHASITGKLVLAGCGFSRTASFPGLVCPVGLHFRDNSFQASVDIWEAVLGRVLFTDNAFHGYTTFRRATFKAPVRFANTAFHGIVDFGRVHCLESLRFVGAAFHQQMYFSTAQLDGKVCFQDTAFHKEAYFDRSVFHRVLFEDVVAHQPIYFHRTTFTEPPIFSGSVRQLNFRDITVQDHPIE